MKQLALILAALAAAPLAYADDIGAQLYDKKCASCHAKDGEGQTKMGAKLEVRPFSDAEVQKKLTQTDLTETVSTGIQDKKMPAFKEKLSAAELDSLVGHVLTTFKKGAPEAAAAPKAEEAKPAETKVEEASPAEAKPTDAKPAETQPVKPSKKAKKSSKKKSAGAAAKVEPPKPDDAKPAAQ